ncbi:hypothetical protein RRG08_042612 [Elysia crispata]|uniref:Uncharacterized protein n=1 Tax=Elysia crispata TaxID=231223 RepID=A0AAE1CK00_9GAST|nr:hypothetical protein RRG08_042612 [Elysia crispata]
MVILPAVTDYVCLLTQSLSWPPPLNSRCALNGVCTPELEDRQLDWRPQNNDGARLTTVIKIKISEQDSQQQESESRSNRSQESGVRISEQLELGSQSNTSQDLSACNRSQNIRTTGVRISQ